MRVTVIPTITAFPWGAPGHCMGALVEELLEVGHSVQWFVAPIDLANPEVARLQARGALVEKLPREPRGYVRAASLRRKVDRLFGGERGLAETVKGFRPDFIYLNQGGTWCGAHGQFFDAIEEFADRFAVICHLNHHQPAFEPESFRRARWVADHASVLYFPSAWTRHLAETQIAQRIERARAFFYPHRFDFGSAVGFPESPEARIAFVGRLDTYHKGLELALLALAQAREEGCEFRFTLYGDGPDRHYLEALVQRLVLQDCVTFAGYSADLPTIWHSNEILLLPSRHEGCAVAMTEAMGFGRPVIATAVGGAPEWVEDGVTGFLAAAPEETLVFGALRRALAQRERWKEMGKAAHLTFKERMPERPARVFLEALRP